ncbi:hypothetical protein P3H15_40920 [Rhodococcus sp. T2V]|uniref:hypothetical protein n=1 Tax=Rhodococcus sp. T2V TaxID=3034164 RepID=UPI0023E18A65|nr:hypothetical protein [Rhodococcus sp. T2V]MDF3311355.1 hypothetical protein [Rhodococcus sp. T2V]
MRVDPAAVAADLEAWCRPGGILDKDGPSASIHLFDPVARRRTRDAIVDAYLAEQTDVGIGRQFLALATEGPPGVGKSSSIDRRHLAGQGWRVLDADTIKDYLLRDAIEQGVYTDLLAIDLADGHRLNRPEFDAHLLSWEGDPYAECVSSRGAREGRAPGPRTP